MIKTILLIVTLFTFAAFSKTISGTVTVDKNLEKELKGGTLFVFAKNAGTKPGDGQMPIAVQRIPNPTFPVHFELSADNAMIKGTPFDGPFVISARYSASGDATDKSGPEGTTGAGKGIKVGATAVLVELKKKN
jgi:hypothetical protein